MKKQVYEIDDNGFVVEIYVAEFDDDGNPIEDLAENIITFDPPDGLYRPKWTGTEWVEDKSRAKFEEDEFLNSLLPSASEIENAEFEIKVLNTLMEVGLI